MVSNCQKTTSSHTSHGDHGEAEACPEPPLDDEPPPLTSGAFGTPLFDPFLSATLVQSLRLFCFARTAGAIGSLKRGQAAGGVASCFPKKAAERTSCFDILFLNKLLTGEMPLSDCLNSRSLAPRGRRARGPILPTRPDSSDNLQARLAL